MTGDAVTPRWGVQPHALLKLEDAWQAIAAEVHPAGSEIVPLSRAAGRVLAQPILASDDYPAFEKAMMDGFAVRSADAASPGAVLRSSRLVTAGRVVDSPVQPGEAVRINTGAPVPAGADAVIRIEDVTLDQDAATVTLKTDVKPGQNITHRGAHIRRGDIILAPPLLLEAPQIGVLATNGTAEVRVYADVTVAIVTTGDEIVPVGTTRLPGQIYESNSPMLSALMNQFGAIPYVLGMAPDEITALKDRLAEGLTHRVMIVAGGMSMGTHDLVPSALAELGVEWKFHGVQMRPGKPVAYGRGPKGQHVFGLPGNPISAYVCSWLFVRMVLRGLQGHVVQPPHRWRATLARELPAAKDPRPAYLPARVWNDAESGMTAAPCAWGGSGDPFGAALANALIVRPDPRRPLPIGSPVDVIFITSEP